jgi:CrcB protein
VGQRRELVAIVVGGASGALARAALIEALPPVAGSWPWATLAANLLGAFVLGGLVAGGRRWAQARPLVGAGFCGALTTFSTLQLELLDMLDAGRDALALAYGGASLAGGLLAVVVAGGLVRRVRPA